MHEKESIAIKLENVSKTFLIRERRAYSIREKIKSLLLNKSNAKRIKALDSISLNVKKGEFVGIIGRNGSGKTTLLRIILGAIKPDKGGKITTHGKILRLSLGLGFDPNLTARHNIYVNGSIMGLTFREIGIVFHDILKFADLEEFVDTPLRYFSSGMYSRLAFSVAMHAKADILLIDEFFGTVGDEAFRSKSQQYFKDKILHDKTVIFVTHQLELIEKFCDYVYVLDHGQMIDDGKPNQVLTQYRESFIK